MACARFPQVQEYTTTHVYNLLAAKRFIHYLYYGKGSGCLTWTMELAKLLEAEGVLPKESTANEFMQNTSPATSYLTTFLLKVRSTYEWNESLPMLMIESNGLLGVCLSLHHHIFKLRWIISRPCPINNPKSAILADDAVPRLEILMCNHEWGGVSHQIVLSSTDDLQGLCWHPMPFYTAY